MSQTQHYLRFQVGHEWYGINVNDVIEVLPFMMFNELPVARPDILGMLQLRDAIMPVIDLRLRFGLAKASYDLNTPIIATATQAGSIGFVVDDVDDLERIDEAQITPHDRSASPYITGVARLANSLLLLLDISLLRSETPTS